MEEIKAGLAGPDRSNWAAFDAKTEAELEASIDIEEEGLPIPDSGHKARGFPLGKQQLTVRYDREIIDWFKARGDHYQSHMNAVLRNYVEDQKDKVKQS